MLRLPKKKNHQRKLYLHVKSFSSKRKKILSKKQQKNFNSIKKITRKFNPVGRNTKE